MKISTIKGRIQVLKKGYIVVKSGSKGGEICGTVDR